MDSCLEQSFFLYYVWWLWWRWVCHLGLHHRSRSGIMWASPARFLTVKFQSLLALNCKKFQKNIKLHIHDIICWRKVIIKRLSHCKFGIYLSYWRVCIFFWQKWKVRYLNDRFFLLFVIFLHDIYVTSFHFLCMIS